MDKEITQYEFTEKVLEFWREPEYLYGSVQFPAAKARDYFLKLGITNAVAMYEEYKKKKGDLFYYAGD